MAGFRRAFVGVFPHEDSLASIEQALEGALQVEGMPELRRLPPEDRCLVLLHIGSVDPRHADGPGAVVDG